LLTFKQVGVFKLCVLATQ